ncbi:hypothetical protein M422DRAFT_257178 [Sphaerobolus stellatus SS14]|uniref:Magnesium chelatase n=1 Tax=Sphaerobolus stellatus (strain SS14) TaxID=990650 RepID=A0A0C9VPS8_SPHS4|nr:hypothetical protein M422DRAFT_257178 [Sphaerobolus stellatus SS14]
MSSNEFLKKVIISVQETYPNLLDISVLTTLLPSLLLGLVARETNVIVSSPQPAEIQRAVSKAIFGVQCKRIKVRSSQTAQQFLESLFVSTAASSSSSSSHRRKSSTKITVGRSVSAPRPSSNYFTEYSDSTTARFPLPRHKTDPLRYDNDATPSLELPQAVIITHLEQAGRSANLALAEVLRTRRVTLNSGAQWDLPEGFFVVYICPPGDNYERPAIHMNLLDHFAFNIAFGHPPSPPTPVSSSPRLHTLSISSPTPQKPPLFPFNELPTIDDIRVSPLASNYSTALTTAIRHHPELDGTFLTTRSTKHIDRLLRASGIVFREGDSTTINEAHVRRVIPPVLIHRLRVREGPREQLLGLMWDGAGPKSLGTVPQEAKKDRRTLKAILADILAEV